MKRVLTVWVLCVFLFSSVCGCSHAAAHYEGKQIAVEYWHTSCFDAGKSNFVYYEIAPKASGTLPYDPKVYEVAFTVTKIKKEGIEITLSAEMDMQTGEDGYESVTSFTLREGEAVRLVTPTVGGGGIFLFSIAEKI